MSDFLEFGDLDLSDAGLDEGQSRLKPGLYLCSIEDMRKEKTKAGNGTKIVVELKEPKSGRTITDYINVHLPGKKQATEIGQRRLHTLLHYAGHPTPSKPKSTKPIIGKLVGVSVEAEEYVDRNGQTKMGSVVASWGPYFDPEKPRGELGPYPEQAQPAASSRKAANVSSDFDDDIPF